MYKRQILASAIFASLLKQGKSGWEAAAIPLFYLTMATLIPLLLSYRIRKTEVVREGELPRLQIFGHFLQLKDLLKIVIVRRMAIAKALFWGYGGVLNLWQIVLARQISEANGASYGEELAKVMVVSSLGIIIGGSLASWMSRKAIQPGLILIGLGGMIGATGLISLASLESFLMYFGLGFAGFTGAVFLVPVNGLLQDLLPAESRGRLLAASSVLDCLAGLGAVLLQLVWTLLDVSIALQSLMLGGCLVGAWVYYGRLYSRETIDLLVTFFVIKFYKIKVTGLEHFPTSGGVLMTPNHVSYIDTLILTAASKRSIRFLMIEDCFETPGVGWFARYANTIPISRSKAKEAIQSAAQALKEGAVVCIFPEGQLTRTGGLSELKRGFELIARQSGSPVLPVYMDGLWGSIFTFDQERVLWKLPRRQRYGVKVLFGSCLQGKRDASRRRLAESYFELGRKAFDQRILWHGKNVRREALRYRGIPRALRSELKELDEVDFFLRLRNAMQLAELVVFKRGQQFGVQSPQPLEHVIALLAFEKRGVVVQLQKGIKRECDHYFTKNLDLCEGVNQEAIFYKIDGAPMSSHDKTINSYSLVMNGCLVKAISTPDPQKIKPTDLGQAAWKKGLRGRFLLGSDNLPVEADQDFFI